MPIPNAAVAMTTTYEGRQYSFYVDNEKDGKGQLILAMLVNYVNMGGIISVVGFCLNPTKVSLISASALSNTMYPLKGIHV